MSHTLPYTKNKNLSLAQNKVFWSGAAYQVLYTCVPWIFPWYSLFLPSDSGWYTTVRSAVPLRTGIPYRTVCHHTHPAWAVFHARLLDNQEGANTEPYVFGKALGETFRTLIFLAPNTIIFHTGGDISSMV